MWEIQQKALLTTEGIDDDTKHHVHEDYVDHNKNAEVKNVTKPPFVLIFVSVALSEDDISDTTWWSWTKSDNRDEALDHINAEIFTPCCAGIKESIVQEKVGKKCVVVDDDACYKSGHHQSSEIVSNRLENVIHQFREGRDIQNQQRKWK